VVLTHTVVNVRNDIVPINELFTLGMDHRLRAGEAVVEIGFFLTPPRFHHAYGTYAELQYT
jgi:hypothetical protein